MKLSLPGATLLLLGAAAVAFTATAAAVRHIPPLGHLTTALLPAYFLTTHMLGWHRHRHRAGKEPS